MGVAKTLPNYKSFTFDGTNSRNYGVYITGQAVFNAPERNVEMVEIPGRNGAYALDKGNFNNIQVTYPAGIFADTEADFAQAVSDLRNFLCSKEGYCRLEDDYNSGEYRMAIYKSGLEVTHDMLIAGEFNIVFECKPQRWLTSGETAVSVASGGKITNPTLFESRPQLQVWGYGNINIKSDIITIENVPIGDVLLANTNSPTPPKSTVQTKILKEHYNNGDVITVNSTNCIFNLIYMGGYYVMTDSVITDSNNAFSTSYIGRATDSGQTDTMFQMRISVPTVTFTAGTTNTVTNTATVSGKVNGNNVSATSVLTITYTPNYSATEDLIEVSNSVTISGFTSNWEQTRVGQVSAYSTLSSLGAPIYIDLDIGEAYKIENNTVISVNNSVGLPAELPTLASGDTTITYDNTITQFKVLPRWWKV